MLNIKLFIYRLIHINLKFKITSIQLIQHLKFNIQNSLYLPMNTMRI